MNRILEPHRTFNKSRTRPGITDLSSAGTTSLVLVLLGREPVPEPLNQTGLLLNLDGSAQDQFNQSDDPVQLQVLGQNHQLSPQHDAATTGTEPIRTLKGSALVSSDPVLGRDVLQEVLAQFI